MYSFTPGLSPSLSLVTLIFLYICSTEVKSRLYAYFAPRSETHPGGNSA